MSFDVLDLTDLSGTLGAQVNANRYSPYATISGTAISAYSNDGSVTRLESVGVSVSQDSTFEFDITPVYMPVDLTQPANRLFYCAFHDAQDDVAAVHFSQAGFAFVGSEGDTPIPLPGTASLFQNGTKYTVRFVLRGSENLIDLYITPSSDVASLGHQLRYTTATRTTAASMSDGFTFSLMSPASEPQVEALIHTLRVSSTALTPNRRPVAVSTDTSGVTGQAVALDASESYDPEGESLTYAWSFTSVPTGSTVTASDLFSTHAFALDGYLDRRPAFVPDLPGLYELSLSVNDGSLDSLSLSVAVQITSSYMARGYTPGADVILSALSDDWQGVEGKEVLLTFWSAVMQLAASDMITLWQNDNNKSIGAVGRRKQRKWIGYDCRVDLTNESFTTSKNVPLSSTQGLVSYQSGTDMVATGTAFLDSSSALFQTHSIAVGTRISLNVHPFTASVVSIPSETTVEIDYIIPAATGIEYSVGDMRTFKDTSMSLSVLVPGQVLGVEVGGGVFYQRKIDTVGSDYVTVVEPFDELFSGVRWEVGDVTARLSFTLPSDFKIQYYDVSIWESVNRSTLESEEIVSTITGAADECIGVVASSALDDALLDSDKDVRLVGFYRTSKVPVHSRTNSIPYLQSVIKDPDDSDLLKENQHFVVESDSDGVYVRMFTTYDDSNLPPDTLWAEYTFMDNHDLIEANFGYELGLSEDSVAFSSLDFDYLSAVRGLLFCHMFGPTIDNLRSGVQIFCGLPFADSESVIVRIEENYTTTTGRIIAQAIDSGLLRTYFYKKSLGLALAAGTTRELLAGDVVSAYAPLSKGVEVVDFVVDSLWWKSVGLLEPEKYSLFQVGLDINIIDDPTKLLDMLTSVIDFVRKVKPVYTDLVALLQARLSDLVSVTESASIALTLSFIDRVCTDSRDGFWGEVSSDGSSTWSYDGDLQYGHADRVCPGSRMLISACAPGGVAVSYGSIHRYGSGVTYGGTQSSQICSSMHASTHAYGGEASGEAILSDLTARTVSVDINNSPYHVRNGIRAVFVDCTNDPITVLLPNPSEYPLARYEVKDKNGRSNVNNITIERYGSETIDGVASDLVLSTALESVTLISDGINWLIGENL